MRRLAPIVFIFMLGWAGCGSLPKIVILQDPLSAEEHLDLGLSYEAKGEWDLAISEYQAALKKGGTSSVIEGYLGNVYYAKKDFASAERSYRRSLRDNPKNAPVLNNLASIYIAEKINFQEAETLARRAIEADPARKAYYLDTLGEIYMERGDYDLARSAYDEAENAAPSDPAFLEALHANRKGLESLIEKKSEVE